MIGPPRSGTTLVGYMLAGAKGVLSLSEPHLTHAFLPDWRLQRFFREFQAQSELRRRRPPFHGNAEQFWRFLLQMTVENGFSTVAIKETYRRRSKLPAWQNEPLLERLLGYAGPTIGLIRHPFDVAASTVKLCRWVTGPRGWLFRIRFSIFPTFANATEVVEWAANNWAHYVPWARTHGLQIYRYEDLVADPQRYTPELCERLGIEFSESMLDNRSSRSSFGGVGDPGVLKGPRQIDKTAIGRGRSLTDRQRAIVAEACRQFAGDFDYSL